MALQVKSDIPEERYWEANRYGELIIKIGRTTTGDFNETSTTSGQVYAGTGGEQELLQQLQAVLEVNNISADDWNQLQSEINASVENQIGEVKQDVLEIKARLEQEDILSFVNQTGYGAFYTFDDDEGIDTLETTATINTSEEVVSFNEPGLYEAKSDGTFSGTREIKLKESAQEPRVGDRLDSTNAIVSLTENSTTNSNYKSVLHFDGIDGSTDFPDEITRVWYPSGSAQVNTSAKKFGTGSLLLDGSSSYIYTFSNPGNIGANDFTIHFWVRPNNFGVQQAVMGRSTVNTDGWNLRFEASNIITMYYRDTGANDNNINVTTAIPQDNQFHHVAISKEGNTIRTFLDGVLVTTYSETDNIDDADVPLCIGRRRTSDTTIPSFDGWIDDFVFVIGESLYNSALTPPTIQSSSVTSTYDITLTLPVTTSDNQTLSFLETDQVLVINDRTFDDNFEEVSLRLYTKGESPLLRPDRAVNDSNAFLALSPDQILSPDNSLNIDEDIVNISTSTEVPDENITSPEILSSPDRNLKKGGNSSCSDSFGTIYYTASSLDVVRLYKRSVDGTISLLHTSEAIGSIGSWSICMPNDNRILLFIVDFKSDLSSILTTVTDIDLTTLNTTLYIISDQTYGTFDGSASISCNSDGTKATGVWIGYINTSTFDSDAHYCFIDVNKTSLSIVEVDNITNVTTIADIDGVVCDYMDNGNPYVAMKTSDASNNDFIYINYYNGSSWLTTNNGRGTQIYAPGNFTIDSLTLLHIPSEISVKRNVAYTNGMDVLTFRGNDASSSVFSVKSYISTNLASSWSAFGQSGNNVTPNTMNRFSNHGAMVDNNGEIYYTFFENTVSEGYISNSPSGIWGSVQGISGIVGDTVPYNLTDFLIPVILGSDLTSTNNVIVGSWSVNDAYNITTDSNVTLTNRQPVILGGVYQPTVNGQLMDLNRITNEYYQFNKTVDSTDTIELSTTGKNVNLDILTYSVG